MRWSPTVRAPHRPPLPVGGPASPGGAGFCGNASRPQSINLTSAFIDHWGREMTRRSFGRDGRRMRLGARPLVWVLAWLTIVALVAPAGSGSATLAQPVRTATETALLMPDTRTDVDTLGAAPLPGVGLVSADATPGPGGGSGGHDPSPGPKKKSDSSSDGGSGKSGPAPKKDSSPGDSGKAAPSPKKESAPGDGGKAAPAPDKHDVAASSTGGAAAPHADAPSSSPSNGAPARPGTPSAPADNATSPAAEGGSPTQGAAAPATTAPGAPATGKASSNSSTAGGSGATQIPPVVGAPRAPGDPTSQTSAPVLGAAQPATSPTDGQQGGPTVAPVAGGVRPLSAAVGADPATRGAALPLAAARPPLAIDGSTAMTTDPGTAGVLRDFQNGQPGGAGSGPLDFTSGSVNPERANALVSQEGGDVGKFNSMIHEVGGPNPTVTQSPMLLRDDKGHFGTASLFQVKGADGQVHLVDGQGTKYNDINDYLQNNQFDDSWTMVRSAHPGINEGGPQQLVSGPAHDTTFGQRVGKIGDKVAGPAMIVGGGLVVLGSAGGEVVSGGLGTPVAAPAAVWGAGLVSAGAAWTASRAGDDLINRYQHGRSLSWSDPQARGDYLGIATAAAGGAGGIARGLGLPGLAAGADRVALAAGGSLVGENGQQLADDWPNLTPQQQAERSAELGLSAGALATPLAGRAIPEGSLRPPVSRPDLKLPGGNPTDKALPSSSRSGQDATSPVGGAAGATTPGGRLPTPVEAQKIVEQAEPIGSAMKNDPYHRAPSFVMDQISSRGSVFRIKSGNGDKTLIQTPGDVNGKAGRFEWIVNDQGKLEHQVFVSNGSINGKPNVP